MSYEPPFRVTAWRTGPTAGMKEQRICYANERQAWYGIAKALVIAKYPRWLTDQDWTDETWPQDRIDARTAKLQALFWSGRDGSEEAFDPDRWKKFVWRVAKFLAFVDKRRAAVAKFAHLTDSQLSHQYQYSERQATIWMLDAEAAHVEMKRRGGE